MDTALRTLVLHRSQTIPNVQYFYDIYGSTERCFAKGFILSSAHQQVERLMLQTGEMARSLKRTQPPTPVDSHDETNGVVGSILTWSDAVISDADNSKQLINHLHNSVLKRDETGNPIETKLRQVSQELNLVINNYVKNTVEKMVRSAQDKCPNVLSEETVVDGIRSTCYTKAQISQELIEEAIVEQAGSTILNKVNEISLTLASTVSDRVIEEVVDSLSKTCKSLQCGGDGPRKRASTGTELSSCISSESSTRSERSTDLQSQAEDSHSHKSDPSPLATPQLPSKRKALHGRKLRPQSVVAESLDSVSELPSSCGQLQHLGKARPRRTKTRAPTRPMGRAEVLEEDHDISQGVDTFFRPGSATPTTPLVSPESENSPRLLKYGSTSSMESYPHGAGRPSLSDKGSIESLTTASEPLVRSESDIIKRRSKDTDDELTDQIDEERRSVSSLIGKLGGESALKLSPDLTCRKLTSLYDATEEEDTAPKRLSSGLQKYGRAIGGSVLAEMKARQKLTPTSPPQEEKELNSTSGLLSGVRLRTTGLKSPNGFSRNSTKDPLGDSSAESSPAISIKANSSKPKLPPPLAPKPRPKSAFSPDSKLTPDSDVVDGSDDATQRSVKQLAASLASKVVVTGSPTRQKSSSLPRNSNADEPSAYSGGQSKALSGQGMILSAHQMEELEETSIDGETDNTNINLQRQTSHKHVVETSTVTIDDVIDV